MLALRQPAPDWEAEKARGSRGGGGGGTWAGGGFW
jgi:hypothetical protein